MKVDNIFEDLSDGKVLIRLLESISGEKVGRVGEYLDFQMLENEVASFSIKRQAKIIKVA